MLQKITVLETRGKDFNDNHPYVPENMENHIPFREAGNTQDRNYEFVL